MSFRSIVAVIPDLMWRVSFPAGANVVFFPISWTFTSASFSPGANATSCTEVASAGMPGITRVPEGPPRP